MLLPHTSLNSYCLLSILFLEVKFVKAIYEIVEINVTDIVTTSGGNDNCPAETPFVGV